MSQATRLLGRSELTALWERSRRWNEDRGITGLLLHDGERFIQALEGASDVTHDLMHRIERDPRHHSISYMADASIAEREFGDWSMAVRNAGDFSSAAAFLEQVKGDVAALSDLRVSAAFIGFAAMGWRERQPYAG